MPQSSRTIFMLAASATQRFVSVALLCARQGVSAPTTTIISRAKVFFIRLVSVNEGLCSKERSPLPWTGPEPETLVEEPTKTAIQRILAEQLDSLPKGRMAVSVLACITSGCARLAFLMEQPEWFTAGDVDGFFGLFFS